MKKNVWLHLIVVLTVVFAFTPLSLAQNYNPLPDTGQTQCYDVAGNVITCPVEGQPLHGQDAQYQGAAPAYLDNGNGTITDLNTGLMWMRATADANGDGTIDSNDRITWQAAIDYCAGTIFAGHGDWRLPTKFELQSIVDYGRYGPSINPVFISLSSYYCSATTLTRNTAYAWYIYFNYGADSMTVKTSDNYVRCVRSGV